MISSKNDDTLFSSYLDSIFLLSNSPNTVNTYKSGLNHFKKFTEQNYQLTVNKLVSSVKDGSHDVYRVFSEYVIYLDKLGKKPKSIKLWAGAVKGYLRHEGIKIYTEDFRQLVRLPKPRRQREEPLTKEIMLRLLRNLPVKLQTVVLVAVASGMRIGEMVQLRISDVDFGSNPTRIQIRAEITKTKEARETYLTSEATIALKDYLSRFFGRKEGETNETIKNQIIFGRTILVKRAKDENKPSTELRKKDSELRCTPAFIAQNSLATSLKLHIKKIPELNRSNENGRKMIHFHAFRKFFRTAVGNAVNRDYAEALMGHHFYLDTYYNLPAEKQLEMYLQAEPSLTLSDYSKIEEKQKEFEKEYLAVKQFIQKHFVGFPEFEKINDLVKEEVEPEKLKYNVSCTECKKFLGQSRSMQEGKLMQQVHKQECSIISKHNRYLDNVV